jgi:prophage antirepressor-like protein
MSERNHGEGDNIVGLPTEFRFDESQVRAVMHDGEPWFIAKDVCDILDIADPRMALSRLDEDEKDTTLMFAVSSSRREDALLARERFRMAATEQGRRHDHQNDG